MASVSGMRRVLAYSAWMLVASVGREAVCAAPLIDRSQVDHSQWDQLLKRHVIQGLVDYQGLRGERGVLDQYLAQLKTADPTALPSEEAQLAFWINAYNASVIQGVLEAYPIKSVKDVRGFFDTIRYQVGGKSLTLNELEAKGRALGEWRMHFALVCASSSCPPLRSEAYVSDRLEAQLVEQAGQFLGDPTRGLRFDQPRGVLWVSRIFKWYATDFTPATRQPTVASLLPLLRPYLDPQLVEAIRQHDPPLNFLDYDWTLNDAARQQETVR